MALALSLLFDRDASQAVLRLWQGLADARISSDMLELNYPPHLTLLVVDDETRDGIFASTLRDLAPLAPRSLLMGDIATFAQTEVVYIGLDGDLSQLFALHRAASALVPEDDIDPHYRTASWTPHVTLQTIGDVSRAEQLARDRWRPRHAAVPVRLELAYFRPVRIGNGIALA